MTQSQIPSKISSNKYYSQTIRREIRYRARKEGILLLFNNTLVSALIMVPLSIMVAIWMYQALNSSAAVIWLITVNIAVFIRFIIFFAFKKNESAFTAHGWEILYSIVLVFSGITWGSLTWVSPINEVNTSLSMVLTKTFITVSILVIASNTHLGSRIAFVSFQLSILIPTLSWLFFIGTGITYLFSISLIAVSVLLYSSFQLQHRSLVSAFAKRFEMRELFKQQQVIFDSVVEGIVLTRNHPERIVKCNRRFAELFELPYDSIRVNPPWIWYGSRTTWKQLLVAAWPVISNGQPYQIRRQLKRKKAPPFWAEITGTAIDPQNLDAGIVWVVTDIDVRLAAENALRLSEQRFRDLVSLLSDVYWVLDEHAYVRQLTGDSVSRDYIPIDLFLGKQLWDISAISGVTDSVWRNQKAVFAEHRPFREFIFQIKGTDRKMRWLSASGSPLFDTRGTFVGYHGVATNITTRILNEEKYRHLAYHDTLTGLPNRRLLEDRLDQAIQVATRKNYLLALLVVDLDGFKPVNDCYGHAVGDLVLEKVASLLRTSTRQMDTVSRVGGDEFVILLPELNTAQDATIVPEKIQQLFSTLKIDGYPDIKVGASIGVSIFPSLSKTSEELFVHADSAMYAAKNQGGRATLLFDPNRADMLAAAQKSGYAP